MSDRLAVSAVFSVLMMVMFVVSGSGREPDAIGTGSGVAIANLPTLETVTARLLR